MAGSSNFDTEVFFSTLSGVNSSVAPDLIGNDQAAWLLNATVRGGKPASRPSIRGLGFLPSGIVQGAGFFSVQGGMLMVSIGGQLYRLRIGARDFETESISAGFVNSPRLKRAWMCETVGSFLVQDGQSDCIVYDGASATRSKTVPRGTTMAYGNGRLWVAINGNELVAGDIVTDVYQSELLFTESGYLAGGGSLSFSDTITGLAFSPVSNTADYGPLLVFGKQFADSVRADITSRSLWAQVPSFVTGILRGVGAVGQSSVTPVNQDLYWRDSQGGIRSLSSALADQSGAGSSPLSREVARITDYESLSLLPYSSSVYFDNRLLVLASPFLNPTGGVSFQNVISLDFAPISTMRGKSPPAYDGVWSGAQFTQLVSGTFDGRLRCFGISSDSDGNNRLWEILKGGRADESEIGASRTVSFMETSRRTFGNPKMRKKLARCDVYLTDIEGEVDLKVYWRPDNQQKWQEWDLGETVCARMDDASTADPHVWKNLRPQYRPQIKTFTIPSEIDDITRYSMATAFEFQLRLKWTGKARIARVLLHATSLKDEMPANRDLVLPECVYNDVTGNTITYSIPIAYLSGRILTTEDGVDILTEAGLKLLTG